MVRVSALDPGVPFIEQRGERGSVDVRLPSSYSFEQCTKYYKLLLPGRALIVQGKHPFASIIERIVLKRGPKPDPERKDKCEKFVAIVNKNEDIARYLSDFAATHIFSDWIRQLESDWHYQDELCKGYDKAVIKEAEQILYKYQSDTKLSKTSKDHATSPLGVARIIAAVQMNLRNSDGSLFSINTLSEWYTEGGGRRWKKKPKQ